MKKLFTLVISFTLVIGFYTISPTTQLNVKAEDSFQTGDTLEILYNKNGMYKNETEIIDYRFFYEEEKINPPMTMSEKEDKPLTISNNEKKLLARLVHAEAKGEPYVGKVAVATVVLNRVEHNQFPDTIKEVIYEKNAFEPVQNGSINEPADKEAFKAVQDALADQGNDDDDELLYFYNPETATSDWILTREVIKTIGNHSFAI